MRERTEVEALYQRVRTGDNYEVLGVAPDAPVEAIENEYQRLKRWLDDVSHPDRDLGDHKVRVEVIASAIETAWRVIGNPRQRMQHDGRGWTSTPSVIPPAATPSQVSGASTSGAAGASSVAAPAASAQAGPRKPAADGEAERRVQHLLAMLDVHLSALLGQAVRVRDVVGGAMDLRDPSRFTKSAEEYERSGQWAEAVKWWHAAALASPGDPRPVLRAASALRRAGAARAFEHYARVAYDDEAFGGDGTSHGR